MFRCNPLLTSMASLLRGVTLVLIAFFVSVATLEGQVFGQTVKESYAAGSSIPVPTRRPQTGKLPDELQGNDRVIEQSDQQSESNTANEPQFDIAAQEACESDLTRTGAVFTRLPAINDGDGCVVPAPLQVSKLASGIAVKPAIIINCAVALAAAGWVTNSLIPASRQAFPDKRLTAVRQASGYVCRPRNNRPGAKLSEHAKANAIDIAGFEFDDGYFHEITIRQRTGSLAEGFQKAVRFSACLNFTTVLGPLSDANHADHLHFDLAARNRGYRLCRFPEIIVEKEPAPDTKPGVKDNASQ